MLFIVQFENVYVERSERLPERAALMPDHLRFLAEQGDRVVAAGAPRASVDDIPAGGVWMLNVESKTAAETCYQEDPFWKAGLRKSVRVSRWAMAY